MYRLVFLSGRYEGKRLMVRQAITLVGRDAKCHLSLPDDELLAPRHARFEERGTGVYLTGLSPEHPVERNGRPVLEPVRLANDDLLTLGGTRLRFQDVIAAQTHVRPGSGCLQPLTLLAGALILAFEIGMLVFLVDWPRHIIRPETEAADIAYAEERRAAEKSSETGQVTAAASDSIVVRPGTEAPPRPAAAGSGVVAQTAVAATSLPADVAAALDKADFAPVNTNAVLIQPPPISAADPAIEKAQRLLAQAADAAQFSDYAQAFRLLDRIHQTAPAFLPAYVEHARLLELRGDLDGARQRWGQILGLAPAGSQLHQQAREENDRLARLEQLQTRVLQSPEIPPAENLPRHIRILEPVMRKMPVDTNSVEMRVVHSTLELVSNAPLFKDAAIQAFVTFYDTTSDDRIQPTTRAITTPSPVALGNAFATRSSIPFDATYNVPPGANAGSGVRYYGFTIHVFAGEILQDVFAKPKKLLNQPIHFPRRP